MCQTNRFRVKSKQSRARFDHYTNHVNILMCVKLKTKKIRIKRANNNNNNTQRKYVAMECYHLN